MTVVTRCQILRLRCIKFDFGWGSAPDPAGGAYSAPPDPLAGFKGPTSKGKKGRGWKGEGMGGREEGEGKGKGGRREGGTCSKVLGGIDAPVYHALPPTKSPTSYHRFGPDLSYKYFLHCCVAIGKISIDTTHRAVRRR